MLSNGPINRFFLLFFAGILSFCGGCDTKPKTIVLKKAKPLTQADFTIRKEVRSLAFGSCANPEQPMPALGVALKQKPDAFIWLGDNIYGDTKDPKVLREKYAVLAQNPDFQALRSNTRLLAVWDDHDYGWNDAGRHYALRDESKAIFLDFWKEPANSPRRERDGIYVSYLFDGGRQDVHVILLDNRTFRDDLLPASQIALQGTNGVAYAADYSPHISSDSTMLGDAQWEWLERQFDVSADVRIIGSSTQFGVEWNGYEAWANYPQEQLKMAKFINQAASRSAQKGQKPIPVVFISGDVHYGEISAWSRPTSCSAMADTIYDITSSGVSSTWDFATANSNRIAGPIMQNNIGVLEIGRPRKAPVVAQLWDVSGDLRVEYDVVPQAPD